MKIASKTWEDTFKNDSKVEKDVQELKISSNSDSKLEVRKRS